MKKITLIAFGVLSLIGLKANAQFSENFDAGTTTPAGWSVVNGGGPGTFVFGTPGAGTAHSGDNVAKIVYNSVAHDDYLVTPQITVTAGISDQLSFWVRNRSSTFIEEYDVKLSTTGAAAADFTFTLLPQAAAPQEWTQITVNLSAYAGQSVYVGFHAVSTDEFELYFDDIVNDGLPSCPAPTFGTATVTSATSATFTWISGGAANSEIAILPAGSPAPGTANDTGINTTGNTYSSTTLTAATPYVFYVRDECTLGTEFSTWAGPFAFTTVVVPGCSTPITPADGATNVPTGNVTFEWTAPTTGDPATSYDLYYGFAPDAANIFVANFETTSALITLTGYDTDFYWRIVPINDGGEATACDDVIWSFTTESQPAAPANDDCSGAIALTVGSNFAANAINVTNVSATAGTLVPSCQANVSGDIWFTVTVPSDGNLVLETGNVAGSSVSDTVLVAYTGTCELLTAVECDDDDSVNGNFSLLNLTGLTPGATLYVQALQYNINSTPGAFQLSAYSTTLATSAFTQNAFKAYPNPVKDVLNLSYYKNISSVAVYNLLGQEVYAKSVNANNDQINLESLSSGNYLVKISSDNEVKTIKITKE